ncbi:MAG TPA: insulinase family protein [Planktothrix sp.]
MLNRFKRKALAITLGMLTSVGMLPVAALSSSSSVTATGRPVESALPNGLKVVLLEDHSYPVVSCFVWYHVGARNEPPGLTGISHVLEHMLFQNVGPFQHGTLSGILARNGAQFNGYTSEDFTTFYEVLHPSKLELALKAEASRMRAASFAPSDLKEEIGRVEQELNEDAGDQTGALTREVRATAFHQHPYGNPVTGWRDDLESLTVGDLKSYYDRYYYPNNATLVLVGDFRSDSALQLVRQYFGPIAKSATPPPPVRAVESNQTVERRIVMKHAAKKEFAYIAYHGPKYGDPDAPATAVLEKVLNAHFNGRIKSKLLEPKICSQAHAAFELKKDPGLFVASLTAAGGVPLSKVTDTWDATIGQLRSQPVSDAELRRAKNQAEYALLNDKDGPYKIGFQLGYCDSMQTWQSDYEWRERLHAVTAGDVERVAKRYLSPDNRVVGLLLSTSLPAPKPAAPANANGKGPVAVMPGGCKPPLRYVPQFGNVRVNGYKSNDDKVPNAPYVVAQLDMDDVSQSAMDTPIKTKTDGEQAESDKAARGWHTHPSGVHKAKSASTATEQAPSDATKSSSATKSKSDDTSAIDKAAAPAKDHPAKSGAWSRWHRAETQTKSDDASSGTAAPDATSTDDNATTSAPESSTSGGATPPAGETTPAAAAGTPASSSSASVPAPDEPSATPSATAPAAVTPTVPATVIYTPSSTALPATPPVSEGASQPEAATPQPVPGAIPTVTPTTPSVAARTTHITLPVKQRRLRNGMNLIVFESHLSPIVQVMGVVKAGEAYEPAGKQGIAELLTSCFNNGSSKLSKSQLQNQQEDLGLPSDAMLRFKCEGDGINFHTRCLSRDLQHQLSILNSILRDPSLAEADFDHAKQESVWLLKHSDEALDRKVERAFYRSVLAPSSGFYPHDPAEMIKQIGQLKPTDVKEYSMQTVAPEATTIVIAGDIDTDVAARLVEQSFDGWTHSASYKEKSEPAAEPNPRKVTKSFVPLHEKGKNFLCFGKLVPINMRDQRYSYLLISDCALINHPLIGRLAQRFNEDPALTQAYSNDEIETRLTQMGASTAWSINMPLESAAVSKATNLMQNELRLFGLKGITQAELTEAKRYLTNSLPVKQASNSQQAADSCLEAVEAGATPNYLETELDDIQNASFDAVNRFLHTEFKPEQATLVVAGDRQTSRDVHGVSLIDTDTKHFGSDATSGGTAKHMHEMH